MKKTFKILTFAVAMLLIAVMMCALVACDKDTEKKDVYFENDMLFKISDETVVVAEGLFGLAYALLDENECYFTFTSDGKVHGQIKTDPQKLESLLDLAGSYIDMSSISEIDLDKEVVDPYVVDMFPGFTLDHVGASFDLMKNSLGLSLIGIDFESDIIKDIERTHKVPADALDRLPANFSFGIAFDNIYHIETVTDAEGNTRQAIYVGDIVAHNENTQPFIIFSTSEKKGKKILELDVEFIMVHLVLEEKL